MTLVAHLAARLLRQGRHPTPAVLWTANAVAAVAFGAAHLPQADLLTGGLTAATVAFVLTGNGLVGLACGWLYWRRGLLAAMAAHFATDVVLKVVLVIVLGAPA